MRSVERLYQRDAADRLIVTGLEMPAQVFQVW
jgi:hypothetical protein